MEVNIHHAKTNLSQLIFRAEAGEEIVIARAGKPVVKLVPLAPPSRVLFKPGVFKGRLTIPDNFLNPDPELEGLFFDSPLVNLFNSPNLVDAKTESSAKSPTTPKRRRKSVASQTTL